MRSGRLVAVALVSLSLSLLATAGRAPTDDERSFLDLYFSEEELEIVSATRSLKSVVGIAENVATVTAEEIELMNAHTVAEALYNVTGIEMVDFKGPGSEANASIHGSGADRVAVMLDGVPLASANNSFQLATLPAQMVRKIEIIKGPASSTWGSSFGGVINVITKSADGGDGVGGTVSASLGERRTTDAVAELRAGGGRLGLYLCGNRMDSDGLRDSHEFTHGNVFGKLSFDAGARTRIDLAGYTHRSDSVNADFLTFGSDTYNAFDLDTRHAKADLVTSFAAGADLRLSAWWLRNEDNFYEAELDTDVTTRDAPIRFERHGFSGNLAWRAGSHAVVAGADLEGDDFRREFGPGAAIERRKYALFVNDTVTAGRLVLTPGLRYDHSSLAGGLASPSLGATYLASRDLLFRAAVSRGFHDPAIVRYFDAPAFGYEANEDIKPEKIWSYQVAVEGNVAGVMRAKLTVFFHDIDDILTDRSVDATTFTTENLGRAKATGGEFEIATNAFKGFVLKGGVHYEQMDRIDVTDDLYFDFREVYGVNASVAYDRKGGFRGAAKAHYLWWDMTDRWNAESQGVVVDLDVEQRLHAAGGVTVRLFAAASNIFNARSYNDFQQRNPDRWVEAGVRCSF